jgi:hypothetical protein
MLRLVQTGPLDDKGQGSRGQAIGEVIDAALGELARTD